MDSNLIPYQPVISDIKNLITSGHNHCAVNCIIGNVLT